MFDFSLTSPESVTIPKTPLDEAIATCAEAMREETSVAPACQHLGNLLQGSGRFQEAIFWHTIALQEQLDYSAIYTGLAKLCTRQRNRQQAIAYYEQAIQCNSNNVTAYRSLANLYAQQGQRLQEAECRYRVAILKPEWANPRNQLHLGNLLLTVDRADEAIACYQRAIQLDSQMFPLYFNLAVAFTQQNRWQEARETYQKVLEINPEHAASYYGLCQIAEKQGDLDSAVQYARQAVQFDPSSFNYCYTLGNLLSTLRLWAEASQAYQQAIELNPDFAWSYHNLGYALLMQDQLAESIAMLRRATEALPDSIWSYYHLGDAFSQSYQWDDAIVAFLTAIRLQVDLPNNEPLGYVNQKLGHAIRKRLETDLEQAIAHYQQALTANPGDAEFYAQLANQLDEVRQIDAAYFFYRLALHLQPNQTTWYAELERVWQQREQLSQQIQTLRQTIAQQPEQSEPYNQLGNLLTSQGDVEEAIALHRQSISLRGWHCAEVRGYRFTQDWFTLNLPIWTQHLKQFTNTAIQALQIGSFEGISTCWLLDYVLTHRSAKITCIDRYFPENFDINIERTGVADKVVTLLGEPEQLLPTLALDSYSLIYVDLIDVAGCNLAEQAQRNATQAWKLLTLGGLMILDDYAWCDSNRPGQEPKVGIDAFLASVDPHAEIVYQGYQIMIKKQAVRQEVDRAGE